MTTRAPQFARPEVTVVYGVDTCEDTTHARTVFDAAGHAFRYVRLDEELAVRQRLHDAGYQATPVIVTPAGDLFMEPDDETLAGIIASAT